MMEERRRKVDGYSHDGFKHLLAMKNIAEHCLMKKKKLGRVCCGEGLSWLPWHREDLGVICQRVIQGSSLRVYIKATQRRMKDTSAHRSLPKLKHPKSTDILSAILLTGCRSARRSNYLLLPDKAGLWE